MDRKKYSKELKAQIALDAIKGQKAFMPIRLVFGRSSYLLPLLLLLATEKIKMLRRKRVSEITCLKWLANCK